MAEQTFFDRGGVTVTQARFVVRGQTYAMQGVTSVRREVEVEEPSRGCPIMLIALGAILVLGGLVAFAESVGAGLVTLLLGGAVVFGGIKWMQSKQTVTTYIVTLNSASGESRALESNYQRFIDEIVAALNNALVARG